MKIKDYLISIFLLIALSMIGSGCSAAATEHPAAEAPAAEAPIIVEKTFEVQEEVAEPVAEEPASEEPLLSAPAGWPVRLTWYLGGDAPADEARVETTLNLLPQMQEAGVQVDLVFIPWDVYPTVLRDTIAIGGNCDLAFVSEQANDYQALASEGFLMPVNDLVNNYAPDIFMQIPKEVWDLAGVNGKIYAVPHLTAWSAPQGIMIDKAMLDKYQIDINQTGSLLGMEQALQRISQGEPQLAGNILGEVEGIADARTWGYEPAQLPAVMKKDDPARILLNWFATPEYRQAIEMLNRWRQAGYLPERPIQPNNLLEARRKGEFPVHFTVFRPDLHVRADLQEGHVHLGRTFQPGVLSEVTKNMTGICANSTHPDRALAFLNLVYTDEAVYNMLAKGIEGVHWSWQDIGRRLITRANSPEAGKYMLERDWMFGNQFLAYAENLSEEGVWQAVRSLNAGSQVPADGAFVFDPAPVAAEMNAIESVIARYDAPLRWGISAPDDPRLGIEAFNRDLQAAGLEKVLQEMQKQLEAYLAKNFE